MIFIVLINDFGTSFGKYPKHFVIALLHPLQPHITRHHAVCLPMGLKGKSWKMKSTLLQFSPFESQNGARSQKTEILTGLPEAS